MSFMSSISWAGEVPICLAKSAFFFELSCRKLHSSSPSSMFFWLLNRKRVRHL